MHARARAHTPAHAGLRARPHALLSPSFRTLCPRLSLYLVSVPSLRTPLVREQSGVRRVSFGRFLEGQDAVLDRDIVNEQQFIVWSYNPAASDLQHTFNHRGGWCVCTSFANQVSVVLLKFLVTFPTTEVGGFHLCLLAKLLSLRGERPAAHLQPQGCEWCVRVLETSLLLHAFNTFLQRENATFSKAVNHRGEWFLGMLYHKATLFGVSGVWACVITKRLCLRGQRPAAHLQPQREVVSRHA
jgi:hypothetical protein